MSGSYQAPECKSLGWFTFMSGMSGWVRLYRKSLEHWLYNESRPHTRREAWEDMLLLANHCDEKVMIEGELIECKRGQSVKSLKSWAKQFKWSIQQIRTFFKLLQKDQMITLEGMRKTTRVTICNYEIYQSDQQADNKQITRRQHGDNKQITTNNNEKNEKNENIYAKAQIFYSDQCSLSTNNSTYKQFADFILGNNALKKPLYGVLSIRDQLTVELFNNLMRYKKEIGSDVGILDTLLKMENDEKYYKGKKSLYTCLQNWLSKKFVSNVR